MIICIHCSEEVTADDPVERIRAWPLGEGQLCHRECAARAVLGSVGHLKGKCPCHGGNEEDPPGMSRREAARAALAYYLGHDNA